MQGEGSQVHMSLHLQEKYVDIQYVKNVIPVYGSEPASIHLDHKRLCSNKY